MKRPIFKFIIIYRLQIVFLLSITSGCITIHSNLYVIPTRSNAILNCKTGDEIEFKENNSNVLMDIHQFPNRIIVEYLDTTKFYREWVIKLETSEVRVLSKGIETDPTNQIRFTEKGDLFAVTNYEKYSPNSVLLNAQLDTLIFIKNSNYPSISPNGIFFGYLDENSYVVQNRNSGHKSIVSKVGFNWINMHGDSTYTMGSSPIWVNDSILVLFCENITLQNLSGESEVLFSKYKNYEVLSVDTDKSNNDVVITLVKDWPIEETVFLYLFSNENKIKNKIFNFPYVITNSAINEGVLYYVRSGVNKNTSILESLFLKSGEVKYIKEFNQPISNVLFYEMQ